MLKVENLSVSIGPIPIIRDATLAVSEGEMCGLIGRNGAGKTTLLRAIMGALPAGGKAILGHADLLPLPAHRRASFGIGYMPEDRRLVPEFTVEENIRLPTWATQADGVDERLEWIFTIMPEVARFAQRRALELSGGQQKMVALARALMAGTRILLLDEPLVVRVRFGTTVACMLGRVRRARHAWGLRGLGVSSRRVRPLRADRSGFSLGCSERHSSS